MDRRHESNATWTAAQTVTTTFRCNEDIHNNHMMQHDHIGMLESNEPMIQICQGFSTFDINILRSILQQIGSACKRSTVANGFTD